jgi:hypothetical protein
MAGLAYRAGHRCRPGEPLVNRCATECAAASSTCLAEVSRRLAQVRRRPPRRQADSLIKPYLAAYCEVLPRPGCSTTPPSSASLPPTPSAPNTRRSWVGQAYAL